MKRIINFDDCDIMEQIDERPDRDYSGIHFVELTKEANPYDNTHWKLLNKKVKTSKQGPKYISENNEI